MKLKIVSYSILKGGAAKAARNFLYLFDKDISSDFEVELISVFGTEKNNNINKASRLSVVYHYFKMLLSRFFTIFERKKHVVKYSLNIFSSNYVMSKLELESTDKEIIHINWINNDTISLRDLNKLFKNPNKKILLTLHDEWFYCASEHYAEYNSNSFMVGYADEGCIGNAIFKLKKKLDLKRVVISLPSERLLERARDSYLLKHSDIHILPNPIDTDVFTYQKNIRTNRYNLLNVPKGSFIIGFGAVSGSSNPMKGFDLLVDSLRNILTRSNNRSNITLLTFGAKEIDKRVESLGCRVINMGFVTSVKEMASVYNYIDVMIVPSRAESFGQVAAESLSCQTPVIAFEYSGLKDIITHQHNGLLAEPFSVDSLTRNVEYFMCLSDEEREGYGVNGRRDIINKFSKSVIAQKYSELLDYVKGVKNEQ